MASRRKNNSKFDFDEIVVIVSQKSKHADIKGKRAIIKGMSGTDEDEYQIGHYQVAVIDDNGDFLRGQFLAEEYLESTGEMASPDAFMTRNKIRVSVDKISGVGKMIDKDNES